MAQIFKATDLFLEAEQYDGSPESVDKIRDLKTKYEPTHNGDAGFLLLATEGGGRVVMQKGDWVVKIDNKSMIIPDEIFSELFFKPDMSQN